MIRILQRQWTISSIIFNFSSSGDFSFSNKQTGTTLVTHRPVIFGSLSFYFLLSASFEPLSTFFSLFNFSTDLTDSGPLREQNSQGGLWESREVQQQTGHLLSSQSIYKALKEVPITRGMENMCIVMTLCGCELNGTYS
jgi:hypothetical protein